MPSTDAILIAIPRATLAAFAFFAFAVCVQLIELGPLWLRRLFYGLFGILILAIPVAMIVEPVFLSRHTVPWLDLVVFALGVLLLVLKLRLIVWPLLTSRPITPVPGISIPDVISNYARREVLIDYGIIACVLTLFIAGAENSVLLLAAVVGIAAFVANAAVHRWLQRRDS
jgi:hypothetical protein